LYRYRLFVMYRFQYHTALMRTMTDATVTDVEN
jgi:hypothetical protein